MFEYLIDTLEKNSTLYIVIFNKLVSNYFNVLEEVFLTTLTNLMKKNKSYILHIVENCLKMDFGQHPKEK